MKILATLLVVLLLAGGAAWWFRDSLPLFDAAESVEVSPEAADRAAEKLAGLRSGDVVRLSSAELSSLLRYRSPSWAPQSVEDPEIRMSGDTLWVGATMPTDRLPSHPELDRVRPLLPENARVEVSGQVRTLDGGRAALAVREVAFAGIPIPARYYPPMLERLGRRDEPGLGADEMALPMPPGVSEVLIADGYLILTP